MKKSTENECRPNFESEFKFLKNMRTLLTLKSIDRLIYRRRNKYLNIYLVLTTLTHGMIRAKVWIMLSLQECLLI